MGDRDRRQSGGGYNNPRKRRYRDDDDGDRRGPRRRFDQPPPHVRVRKQLLAIAENPMRAWHEEVQTIATILTDAWDSDELLHNNFVELVLQLAVEQPLKTPFTATVVLVAGATKPDVVDLLLTKLVALTEKSIATGEWRDVKLYLKLLACLQSCLEGDGIFPVLEDLFSRAVDLQTASSEDTIGTELVKIILLTLPYVMSTEKGRWNQKAADLMDKTEIIAGEPHALQVLVDPYHMEADAESPTASLSVIGLLQKQLSAEASTGWQLACLPRPWDFPPADVELQNKLSEAKKRALPTITVPETVIAGPRPLFPEVYFSVCMNQEVESVPPVTNIAASLIRDALLDTMNILDYNRNITARYLIEVDCYFAPRIFAARATPFDRLKEIEPPKSTWKPEDAAVDAVFSQLFQLPNPEHKLVYYHSVLTEACRQAPAAIAPSLGRAIRFLYRNVQQLDLELVNRFTDWFAHHLSNFGFTWKWTEWVEDVFLSDLHAPKAFILGAIDKEIRLSFAQRIKNTLPDPYKPLIGPEKEVDVPVFKFANDATPFAAEGREIAGLLKRKAPDEEIQPVVERIHGLALDARLDPLVTSTDIFTTAVLQVGNKSLSHVLAAIERTKDRLLDAGAASELARTQIIAAVMSYWAAQPGIAISIIEKLLNYGIIYPITVIQWALLGHAGSNKGDALAKSYIYEIVFNTVVKVTGRVRQVAQKAAAAPPAASEGSMETDEAEELKNTRNVEVKAMRDLFKAMEDALVSWANGTKDELIETEEAGERLALVRRWGDRWLRVFRRRAAIEDAFLVETEKGKTKAE